MLHPNEIVLVQRTPATVYPMLALLTSEAEAKGPAYVEAVVAQFERQLQALFA